MKNLTFKSAAEYIKANFNVEAISEEENNLSFFFNEEEYSLIYQDEELILIYEDNGMDFPISDLSEINEILV